jgi:hypothetical protein
MKAVVLAAALCAAVTVSAEETKLGAGVSLKEATPISAIVDKPEAFVGKTIRIDGVATAVCQAMGCWMAIAPEGDATGPTVRLKVEHGGGIVFPISAKGKKVSAEGVFEQVTASDAEGKEAAGEHAKHDAKASKTYQIKATGALIK